MKLVEVLPKDIEGNIILSPAGEDNGILLDGTVDPVWFSNNFVGIASATVPLTDAELEALRAIDTYWARNADRWRGQGVI